MKDPAGPRVSVLLPARDAAATVVDAVRSVLDGTYKDLEIVAIDDGSRDGTADLLHGLARVDPRVRVLSTEGVGIARALAVAHAAASGSLIARQDADDRSAPTRLDRAVQLLDSRTELDAVGCAIRGEPAELVSVGMRRYEDWQNALLELAGLEVVATSINPRHLRGGRVGRLPSRVTSTLIVAYGTPRSRDEISAALSARGSESGRHHWLVG